MSTFKHFASGFFVLFAAFVGSSGVWGQTAAPSAGAVQYHPITEADAAEALAQVVASAGTLEQRFAAAGDTAASWKSYLGWDKFQEQIHQPKPEKAALTEVYTKLAAGYEGLEQAAFANLRTALGQYLVVAAAVGNPNLESAVKTKVEEVNQQLKSLGNPPTSEQTRKLSDSLLWLETARQAPQLVQGARARFAQPNFKVQVSGVLINQTTGGPVDDVAPIDDVILGTTIHGTGHTVGQTSVKLAENPNVAMFDVFMQGTNYSNNVGRNGPVCIYSTGTTCLSACKRFWYDGEGMHALPATANAEAHTTINNIQSIKGRQLIENIAWKKACKSLPQAESIASQHAMCKLSARVDEQAAPQIAQANEQFEKKARKPLAERRAFPHDLGFATTAAAIEFRGVEAMSGQLAAPDAPPALTQPAEIALRVHESAINNGAETMLTGMRLSDDMIQRMATEILGRLPDELKPDPNQEPFTIVFPKEQLPRVQPVTVTFGDGGYSVTLRGQEYIVGEKRQPGMNITANYKFVKTPSGYKTVRQGDLQIYGYGQQPGTPRAFRQQAIYTAIQRKFAKVFAPEAELKGLKPEGKLGASGPFVPTEIISQNGWLAVGYNRVLKPASATAMK